MVRLRPVPHRPFNVLTLAVFTIAWCLASAASAQFTLASLNCLHLGQGSAAYQANKEAILQPLFANYDVVVLQEVMRQANLGSVTPGAYNFIVTPVQGPGTYKEAYAFLVRNAYTVSNNTATLTNVAGFARPPAGILLDVGGQWTWIIDYHAVYGRSISVRRAEVQNIQLVYQGFQTTMVNGVAYPRAVVAGDWNLGANDPVFQGFVAGGWPISVQPTVQTSLKRNGGLSQPYDHFLWDTTAVMVTAPQVIPMPTPPGSDAAWRQQVSDHLGIECTVN
ncbi:MAG: endonuclease/exonuclease/phosphatase family protein [Acidobacteriota bacterium]